MTDNNEYHISVHIQEVEELWKDTSADICCRYVELYRIFNEILAEGTQNNKIEFTSPFARFTYIAQQKDIEHSLIQRINGLRARCRSLKNINAEEQKRCFPFDFKALIEFLIILNDKSELPDQTKDTYHQSLLNLMSLMPAGYAQQRRQGTTTDCIRVSVISYDDEFIYAHSDNDEQEEPIRISYTDSSNYLGDWSYIGKLLELDTKHEKDKGVQLNLVRPRFHDGTYYPELIIYQPDYLIDISSIAKCFEQHGRSPYLHIINKFKDNAPSKPKLLGNFAGQLLDEEINSNGCTTEYGDSIMTFFRRNAMSIVACKDDMSEFHNDAKTQQSNIRSIIKTATEEDKTIDISKVLLEPSFFCEMLGIQGRMDLLHSDYKVLMEQKSGKKDYKTNGHVEQHYVQVLLYMALLHYSFHLHNDEISCFLLYSKYSNGLIKEGPAPMVLFEAIKIRNQITWNEFQFADGDTSILDILKPEHLNTREVFDKFWNQYKLPEYQGVLYPFQKSSPLERAYVYRMLQFISKEHILSKCGTADREGSGMAAIWNSTTEEKRLAGNIFDNLRITNPEKIKEDAAHEGISEITLQVPPMEDEFLPNFRIGDIVILYKYNKEDIPDARKGIVFRTSIKDIKNEQIILKMRAPQKNADIFHQEDDTLWAIEHDFMESSYSTLYRSLFSFLKANEDRKNLILNQRKPRVNTSIRLNNDYSMGGKSPMFNELVLKAMQAEDYFIVIGPPGTGKTSFGMLNILKETLSYPEHSVLLLSYTNRAVDEICSKMVKDGIDFIRIGSELTCSEPYKDFLLENKAAKCSNAAEIRNMLLNARVFVGTTTSLSSHTEIFTLRHFSLAIIDEASQILEPHLLAILSAKHGEQNAIDKFVFIGDHKQLPAVVQQTEEDSSVSDKSLNDIGLHNCRHSLFERLLRMQGDDSRFIFRLNRQGRMHHDVAAFARLHFYEDNLNTVPMAHQHKSLAFEHCNDNVYERILSTHRLAFINVDSPQRSPSYKVNIAEAIHIAEAVHSVWNLYTQNDRPFLTDHTIGVIVPYRHQIATIRNEIDKYNIPELHNITIDTVERFQGSERDVIIYGFTVQKRFQLDFLTNNTFTENDQIIDRKLNVAMTRAREQMLLVGNASLLEQSPVFRQLITFISDSQSLYSL